MNQYTNLETSKKLKEWGCEIKSNAIHADEGYFQVLDTCKNRNFIYNANNSYDLLWDICIKYPKEFFGTEKNKYGVGTDIIIKNITSKILYLLQEGKEKEANEYLLKNTIFNPKNK